MRFREYPILKLLIDIIIGILLAHYVITFSISWLLLIPLLLFMAFLAWPKKYLFPYKYRYFTGIYIHLVFIIIGIFSYQFHYDNDKTDYFGNYTKLSTASILRITEPPQEKAKSIKIFADVVAIQTPDTIHKTIGKTLVYLQKDSAAKALKYGDKIILHQELSQTQKPTNPDQFNYKAYLHLNGIDYQTYVRSDKWKFHSKSLANIKSMALNTRTRLLKILYANNIQDDELSVAAGMLLGVRDMLSPELRQAYAGAGAMHILCVSGLHVGIIYMILAWMLKFLNKKKHGKKVKTIIIISIIWFYALLTGFSPSVVRAATMFSFIVMGQNLRRRVNIIGSLSASAFVLLIIDPSLIFNLGFQLSYSAVVAIVFLQKPISFLWIPNSTFLFRVWQLMAVSLAAQIGTAPLSMYYFHQFPNFFLITNLIVIPAAYVIIMLGIAVVATSFIPIISSAIGWLLSYFLSILNSAITYIEHFEYSVISNIYFGPMILALLLLLVFSISYWLILQKKKFVFVNLSLILLILIMWIFNFNFKNEFVVYNTNRASYFAIYSQGEAWILADSMVLKDPSIASFSVEGHELRNGIKQRHYINIDTAFYVQTPIFELQYPFLKLGDTLIALNTDRGNFGSLKPDYYLFANKQYRFRKQDSIPNCSWVITANIPPWESKKILPVLDSLGIEVYNVKEDGAWVLNF